MQCYRSNRNHPYCKAPILQSIEINANLINPIIVTIVEGTSLLSSLPLLPSSLDDDRSGLLVGDSRLANGVLVSVPHVHSSLYFSSQRDLAHAVVLFRADNVTLALQSFVGKTCEGRRVVLDVKRGSDSAWVRQTDWVAGGETSVYERYRGGEAKGREATGESVGGVLQSI